MRDIVRTRTSAYTFRSRFQQCSFQQLKVLEGWGMDRRRITISIAGAVALVASLFGLPATGLAAGAGDNAQSLCIAPHPQELVWYTHSCTGQAQPETDPPATRARPAVG